jgi:hypothetical protein
MRPGRRATFIGGLVVLAGALVLSPSRAAADEPERSSLLDRPHTVAQLEAGILALPNAPISPSNAAVRGGNTPFGGVGNGDATLEVGAHVLYRGSRDWAIGAGALFAPRPTSDPNYGGASGLQREHARSYLFLGAEGRYFPFHTHYFDGWIGLATGAIIVADRFTTDNAPDVPRILGNKAVTVSTEGFAIGLQAGADYIISDQLVVGLALRADRWFLPAEKPFSQESSCDSIGDCPTLTGTVAAFEIGLTVGYRLQL